MSEVTLAERGALSGLCPKPLQELIVPIAGAAAAVEGLLGNAVRIAGEAEGIMEELG